MYAVLSVLDRGKGRSKAVPTNAITARRASADRITLSFNLGRKWWDG